MGKINSAQRAALEAAGYTISKSGNTVLTSEGKSIGGYNENGQIFSGSSKVRDILKNTKEAPAKAAEAPAKAAPAKRSAEAPTTSKRPKAKPEPMKSGRPGTGVTSGPKYSGRGNGSAEMSQRSSDNARKAQEKSSDIAKKVAAAAAAAGGVTALMKAVKETPRKPATPTIKNPNYGKGSRMAEGFQGRYATEVGRPGNFNSKKGLAGNPDPAGYLRGGGGGRMATMPGSEKDDKLPMFSKGGMVKKGKK